MDAAEIADIGAKAALERNAKDVVILDLKGLSSVTDFFVICTGNSTLHVEAIAEFIEEKLREHNVKLWNREGVKRASWILLDYIDVMIHIFTEATREFYGLERLWGDAPRKEYSDNSK